MTSNNSINLIKKAQESSSEDQQFPMLVWSDFNTQTEIYLINDDKSVKQVNLIREGSIANLITDISKIIGEPDVLSAAYIGDELVYPIDLIEFQDDDINWKPLLANISKALEQKPELGLELEDKLKAELNSNFRSDLIASSLNAAYASIIGYLAHVAHDLGVNSLGIDGLLSTNEQFRHQLIKQLNETYPIHFV